MNGQEFPELSSQHVISVPRGNKFDKEVIRGRAWDFT